ncbi:MAG TPA: hypothetical protein DCP19_07715 [Pseudomonas sp.]|nr:hypothetical protein [Pseudomonas sp.]
MPGLDSDFREALRYAIRNCPARTAGQLAAIDLAGKAISKGPSTLAALELKTLNLELGFWLTHYQRLQEFSSQRLPHADAEEAPMAPDVESSRSKAG